MWSLAAFVAVLAAAKVVFVQEVCRHGSRAPVNPDCCPWDDDGRWGSQWGELTTVGMRMHFLLGSELRQRYVFAEQLLSPSYNATEVYFRSTDLNRTIMSAQSQLMGLFPASTGPELGTNLQEAAVPPIAVENLDNILQELDSAALPNLFQSFPVHIFPYLDDFVLLPNAACSALYNWNAPEGVYENILMSNPWLLEALQTLIPGSTTAEAAEMLLDVVDDIYCNLAMNFKLPAFPTGFMANVTSIFNQVFAVSYQSDVNARLFASWFFLDLLSHLEGVVAGTEPTKFRLYSAHDTTVAGILAGMQVFDDQQPPFASSLIFEVSRTDNNYFVRVLYNDKPLVLPMCRVDLCPIDTLMTYLRLRAYASTDVCAYNQTEPWENNTPSEEGSDIRPGKGSRDLKWVAWVAAALCVIALLVIVSALAVSCRRQGDYAHVDNFDRLAEKRKQIINDA